MQSVSTIINQYTIRRVWTEFVLVAYVNLLSLVLHKRGNSFLDLSQFVLLCMLNLHYLLTSLLVAHICTQSVESNVLVCVPASHWDILTWECAHVFYVLTRAKIRALYPRRYPNGRLCDSRRYRRPIQWGIGQRRRTSWDVGTVFPDWKRIRSTRWLLVNTSHVIKLWNS